MAATRKVFSKKRGTTRRSKTMKRPGLIGPLKRDDLKKFGYANVANMSAAKRHAALAQAVKIYGQLSVFRKLNAVYVLTRHTSPASSRIFKADRDWVKITFFNQ
jgi:hypothetical protein